MRPRDHRRLAVIALLLATFGPPACGMVRDSRPAQYAELQRRAAFDLRCEQVHIQPIKEGEGSSCTTTFHSAETAGVTCGDRQATYEYVHGRWLMNNDGRTVR